MSDNLDINNLLNQLKEAQIEKQTQYEDKCWFCGTHKSASKKMWVSRKHIRALHFHSKMQKVLCNTHNKKNI